MMSFDGCARLSTTLCLGRTLRALRWTVYWQTCKRLRQRFWGVHPGAMHIAKVKVGEVAVPFVES